MLPVPGGLIFLVPGSMRDDQLKAITDYVGARHPGLAVTVIGGARIAQAGSALVEGLVEAIASAVVQKLTKQESAP